jgi:hypothetical protein
MNGNGSKLGRRGLGACAVGLALSALLGSAVPAAGRGARAGQAVRTVNVLTMLHGGLAFVRSDDGGVPVLLPSTLQLAGPRSTASTATARGYTMELDYSEPCNGANVCMVAEFSGRRGSAKPYGRRVSLTDGLSGAYSGLQCGASCSPAAIQWREHGVLYTITATLGVELQPHASPLAVRDAFVAAADQAISAGPR